MKNLFLVAFFATFFINPVSSQKKVAITSLYLDKEVDFSLMQVFKDDSKKLIQGLVSNPEFDLSPLITDMHDFLFSRSSDFPFEFVPEESVLGSEVYQGLENTNKYDDPENHLPYKGYSALGMKLNDNTGVISKDLGADGVLTSKMVFYVRKNMLKTVIQAQLTMSIYNAEGKKAWNYVEYGISPEGVTTFAGFVIDKKDEVYPMFESAVERLKEKMTNNLSNRAEKSNKKL